MKKLILRNESGFTLIELMVVVAIIGVLSAIAVPNFKKYQAKAKQSEAKIQLAAIYTIEVGAMADYDSYASCLIDLGYDTPARGYYVVGFKENNVGNLEVRSVTCDKDIYFVTPGTQLKAGAGEEAPVDASSLGDSEIAVDFQTFTAEAAGNISGTLTDKWTIDSAKALTNISFGGSAEKLGSIEISLF